MILLFGQCGVTESLDVQAPGFWINSATDKFKSVEISVIFVPVPPIESLNFFITGLQPNDHSSICAKIFVNSLAPSDNLSRSAALKP